MLADVCSRKVWSVENIFQFRYAIARIGEADWLNWWTSHALGETGSYLIPRLFNRTPLLSAAHMAILSARTEQSRSLPREPLVHLFNLGTEFEGSFERWLIERKTNGWTPKPLPENPPDSARAGTRAALEVIGIVPNDSPLSPANRAFSIGEIPQAHLTEVDRLETAAELLAGAYIASEPNQLIVPYLQIKD
ncbi:BrxE family protein [Gemmatimonadota bacterium]